MTVGSRYGRSMVLFAVVAGLFASTAACGTRWTDTQRASVAKRYSGARVAASNGDTTGDLTTGDTVPGDTTGTGTGSTGGTGTGTGSTGGTGTGSTGGVVASGAKPCAAASTAPGVTASTITVGSISTVSGPVPGLGETTAAGVRAYVAYKNATGGVCGRKLALKTGDDGYENSRYREILTSMNPQVLGLAGGLGGGDGGSVDIIEANKIPIVATALQDSFQASPYVFDINPPFANVHAKTAKYEYLYAQGMRTAALVYIDVAQVKVQVAQQRAQMEASGIKIVYDKAVPLSTLSYDEAARGVANSKADALFYPAQGNLNASMAKSMYNTGYKLKFPEYLTAYGSNFIELSGPAAEGAISFARALPNEEPNTNAAQTAFNTWMNRAAPGVTADTFAADAWASAAAFFESVEALPGPISRATLLTQLRSVSTFDDGGFFGPIQLGKKLSNGCVIGMKVVNGKWQRFVPAKGFLC